MCGSWQYVGAPPRALLRRDLLANMLRHHTPVAAISFSIEGWPTKNLTQPRGDALRMIWRHFCKQRPKQRISWDVAAVENPSHVEKRGISSDPLEQRWLTQWIGYWILKFDAPVHSAAERLVEGRPAPAQPEVLPGSTFVLCNTPALSPAHPTLSPSLITPTP